MVPTRLGALHDRHPLVVITEEGEVEVGAATVGLSADGKLPQQPPHGFRVPTVLCIHNGVLESEGNRQVGGIEMKGTKQKSPPPTTLSLSLGRSRDRKIQKEGRDPCFNGAHPCHVKLKISEEAAMGRNSAQGLRKLLPVAVQSTVASKPYI